jgi:hypothetical protein
MISGEMQQEYIDFKVIFMGVRPSSDHSEGKDHVRDLAFTQPTFSLQHYRCRNNGVRCSGPGLRRLKRAI